MTPAAAYEAAHERILRCADILKLVTMALDGSLNDLGSNEREALATVTQCALDEARAARECFPHIPRPKDPL